MVELGSKHECYACGAKFYDLGKSELICPKCQADQRQADSGESPPPKSERKAGKKSEPAEAEAPAPEKSDDDGEAAEGDELEAEPEDDEDYEDDDLEDEEDDD